MFTLKELEQFIGTEYYYRHFIPFVLLTEGTKYIYENGAAWLIDKIASLQLEKNISKIIKQNWILETNKREHSAVLKMTTGNDNLIYSERINYTDFPVDGAFTILADLSGGKRIIFLLTEY